MYCICIVFTNCFSYCIVFVLYFLVFKNTSITASECRFPLYLDSSLFPMFFSQKSRDLGPSIFGKIDLGKISLSRVNLNPFESIHEVVPSVRPCAPSSDRPYSAHGGSLCKLKPAPTGMGFYTESRRSAIHYSYFQISGAFWCQSVSQQLTV